MNKLTKPNKKTVVGQNHDYCPIWLVIKIPIQKFSHSLRHNSGQST